MRKILGRGGRGKEGHARGKRQRERARTDGKASGRITKEFGGSEHFQETSYRKTRKKLGKGKIGYVLTRRIHNRTSLSTELLQQFRIAPHPHPHLGATFQGHSEDGKSLWTQQAAPMWAVFMWKRKNSLSLC